MKKYNASILVVDDDEHVLVTTRMILKQYFENIDTLNTPKSLENKLRSQEYDVVLLDMNFNAGVTTGNEGIFWMSRVRSVSPQTQVVLQTAYGDIELAVRSIKEGAVDFLPKPWDKEKLVATVLNAYQQACARKENSELKTKQKALQHHINQSKAPFIASAESMKAVLHSVEQVAATDAAVLITGENGTGKEVVARAIHEQSARADEPFIAVDMGAIPASLFEAEMFGHEKGAYTDAKETRIGKFELAHRGTLFLDEIGNLTADLQSKLLTVLQNKKVTRLGSNKVIDLDIRVICATNASLQERIKAGAFRQDLFYRINTVEIPLPPLRSRKEDIPLLLNHYLDEFSKRYQRPVEAGEEVIGHLLKYAWPGNVRELRHAIERAVILSRTPRLSIGDFQLLQTNSSRYEPQSLNLSEMEKAVIQEALIRCQGNVTRASEELGIGRTTLYRKLEEYGLTVPQER
ncbi:MAG TPA: sigma-54 dependent transcriptional regulator [Cyclobacteriaceae bacterium]|nr:sigma-54 dependent transcriptional regulator [Cyclobacteriaceae bacterium]